MDSNADRPPSRSPIRLGVIGIGRWGQNILRTIVEHPRLAASAVASTSEAGAAFAHQVAGPGCRVFRAWSALIDSGTVDGVVVATPPQSHFEIATAALDAGLPVLVEKPLTIAADSAANLAEHAARSGVVAMVDHTQLFAPGVERLLTLVGQLGPLRGVKTRAGAWGPFRPDVPVLWDWSSHDVAFFLALLGTLKAGPRGSSLLPQRADIVDLPRVGGGLAGSVYLQYAVAGQGWDEPPNAEAPPPLILTARASNVLTHKERAISVWGESGSLHYREHPVPELILRKDDRIRAVSCTGPRPLAGVLSAFGAAIDSGVVDRSGFELGVRVVESLARAAVLATS